MVPTGSHCLAFFAGLPLIFMLLPTVVMTNVLHSVGSVAALSVMLLSLCIGWGYRVSERWFLDGNPLMRLVHWLRRRLLLEAAASVAASVASSGVQRPWMGERAVRLGLTTLAAIVSPTQILHTFTGVTLLAGYMHARSLDP